MALEEAEAVGSRRRSGVPNLQAQQTRGRRRKRIQKRAVCHSVGSEANCERRVAFHGFAARWASGRYRSLRQEEMEATTTVVASELTDHATEIETLGQKGHFFGSTQFLHLIFLCFNVVHVPSEAERISFPAQPSSLV